ncbi:hypothetical protein [Cryobacterium sp. PH31-O1]|uniref:hypothetical protein n=1 Tax=Cryobacterium sp. PH31-O1 TaxID=3046306 RepID=UPI0024BA0D9B|nr:hypothetical protein [Cryobacterium sp. PH31-O1]MDJ0338681.1 hypothetical protein [Cryobacterium sp. PH31-O1]
MLDIIPDGPLLSPVQAKQLDDEFFLARPLPYFSARIASLLKAQKNPSAPDPDDFQEFYGALGLPSTSQILDYEVGDRQLQVSVDALALRHHAAEALIRFLHAVTVAKQGPGDAPSTWVAIADGPPTLFDVAKQLREVTNSDEHAFWHAFIKTGVNNTAEVREAFATACGWVDRAIQLLTDDELTINAAHNKVKHGLAISARNDVRIDILRGNPPEKDGTIPLSSFQNGNSIPLFDRPMLSYLARPHGKPRQGLEITSLQVDLPIVLAETRMIAVIYAACFHVAALAHFGVADAIAPYPVLHKGPTPEQLLGHSLQGYRATVTTPPDGKTPPRPSGLFFPGVFQSMVIDFENITQAVVVDG